jgi:hypothetical protein
LPKGVHMGFSTCSQVPTEVRDVGIVSRQRFLPTGPAHPLQPLPGNRDIHLLSI